MREDDDRITTISSEVGGIVMANCLLAVYVFDQLVVADASNQRFKFAAKIILSIVPVLHVRVLVRDIAQHTKYIL